MAVAVRIHVERGHGTLWQDGRRLRAFELMYRRWYPDVLAMCKQSLGRGGDAEATAQEAFIRAWLALDRYSPARPFWPWLAVITRRLCLDHRRRLLRESAHVPPAFEPPEEPHPEWVVEAGEDLRTVLRAMDRLRPHERRALMLREVEGWSYQQIATFEGVTVESVRGTLKRARASLRQALRAEEHCLDLRDPVVGRR
ncbi:MAG: RNA polymerase sigma factor [Actinomycetota bacterium]|nr:RNA polymerase sigma factor [Actinomycetota bacterium]